jgi:hypothetical protein
MKGISCVFALMLVPCLLLAQPQSENFVMTKQVLDAGGAASVSESFTLYTAYGQPSPIGVQASETFILSGGFLSPRFAVSPVSPIQELVILQDQPDVVLFWEPIQGANSYIIYRSDDPMFTPGPGDEIGIAPDTTFTDTDAATLPLGKYFYIVTASTETGPVATAPVIPPSRPANPRINRTATPRR